MQEGDEPLHKKGVEFSWALGEEHQSRGDAPSLSERDDNCFISLECENRNQNYNILNEETRGFNSTVVEDLPHKDTVGSSLPAMLAEFSLKSTENDGEDLSLAQKLTASQFTPPQPGTRKTRRSMVYGYKTDKRIVEMTGQNLCTQLEEALELQMSCSLRLGGLCYVCSDDVEFLASHVAEKHICLSYRPIKKTNAYHHHTQERYIDFPRQYSDLMYGSPFYICRECGLYTKKMDVAWGHIDVHSRIYQVNDCKSNAPDCECSKKGFSFKLHEWRTSIHETFDCFVCGSLFVCEKGLELHFKCLHIQGSMCRECLNENVKDIVTHNESHKKKMFSEHTSNEVVIGDYSYVPFNTLNNHLNYLDGRSFRLNTVKKGDNPNSDRSKIKFPIFNVPENFSVANKQILNAKKELNKYKRGKQTIKLPNEDKNLASSFDLEVQLLIQKKCSLFRRGRKCFSSSTRAVKEDDLFSVLGLKRNRNQTAKSKRLITQGKEGDAKVLFSKDGSVANISADKPDQENLATANPQTSKRILADVTTDSNESESVSKEAELPDNGVVVSGEWSSEHTFVCCACGSVQDDLAEIMDHKWAHHTGVLCAHTMMQGKPGVPIEFCQQYQTAVRNKVVVPLSSNSNGRKELKCSKCASSADDMPKLHAHMVECGNLLDYDDKLLRRSKKGIR